MFSCIKGLVLQQVSKKQKPLAFATLFCLYTFAFTILAVEPSRQKYSKLRLSKMAASVMLFSYTVKFYWSVDRKSH